MRSNTARAPSPMSAFFSPYRHQFVRVASCVPQVAVAEPAKNADQVLELLGKGDKAGVGLMVFPELCLSAYAVDDLLFQDAVLDAVTAQIERLAAASKKLLPVFVVGAPLRWQGRLYNCGVAIHRGRLLGIVPKVFLPNYREFYERRHFTSGEGVRGATMTLAGQEAPFGIDLLFVASGALSGRLRLFRRRRRRVDDRPCLGRPGRDLRDRRHAGRDRAVQRHARDG